MLFFHINVHSTNFYLLNGFLKLSFEHHCFLLLSCFKCYLVKNCHLYILVFLWCNLKATEVLFNILLIIMWQPRNGGAPESRISYSQHCMQYNNVICLTRGLWLNASAHLSLTSQQHYIWYNAEIYWNVWCNCLFNQRRTVTIVVTMLGGHGRHLVQTLMVLRGWILMTFVIQLSVPTTFLAFFNHPKS